MNHDQTPVTKQMIVEFITEYMQAFEERQNKHFESIHRQLNHHDDLLETISTEVSETQNILTPLVPKQSNHEERIARLERGYTRLILRS